MTWMTRCAGLTEAEKVKVLSGNAAKLYNIQRVMLRKPRVQAHANLPLYIEVGCRAGGRGSGCWKRAGSATPPRPRIVLPALRWPLPPGDLLIGSLDPCASRSRPWPRSAPLIPRAAVRLLSPVANPGQVHLRRRQLVASQGAAGDARASCSRRPARWPVKARACRCAGRIAPRCTSRNSASSSAGSAPM